MVRKSSSAAIVNFAVLAAVPVLAMLFLLSQGQSIAASLFVDAPPAIKMLSPSEPSAAKQKTAYVRSKYGAAVAVILDNWEYTTHCISGGGTDCPNCAAQCGGTIQTTCGVAQVTVAGACGANGSSANCGGVTGSCGGCCVGF